MDKPLPALGAAIRVEHLSEFQEWLLGSQRDIELQDGVWPQALEGDLRQLAKQARSVLDGHSGRLGIHGPFINLNIGARDPKIRTVVVERLQQALDFAVELGATHMVIHSPFDFPGVSPFIDHTPEMGLYEEIARVHETLEPILPTVQQAGVMRVIENNCWELNPAPLAALVESLAAHKVRMSIDTGHAYVTYRRGGPSPDQWVRTAGKQLEHLHVQDTVGEADRHWMPPDGEINWYSVILHWRLLRNPLLQRFRCGR